MKVTILGGYGVFGGRLARLLREDGFDVYIAGRSLAKAEVFAAQFGGTAAALDRRDVASVAHSLAAGDVLVDAVGPFQGYDGYDLARAVIEAGAHYLDLSDDAGFTTGISTLDGLAQKRGVMALSGLSSVPALSSAAVDALRANMSEITLIESAILPGNRAPRGASVIAAILSQVGRPLSEWRGGQWVLARGWGAKRDVQLSKGRPRPASPIGAPDLALFPDHYNARSVRFFAGLELGVMHHGLRALGWLHAHRVLPRLDRFVRPLGTVARLLEPFGTDTGGMVVRVAGRRADAQPDAREWRLIMPEGQGPFVPAVPGLLVIRQIAAGQLKPGARPALGCFALSKAEQALAALSGRTQQVEIDQTPLFEKAIGADAWRTMPQSYRDGHDLWDRHVMHGTSSVARGHGVLARLVAALFRFPPARAEMPVTVTMERIGQSEHWLRDFDGQRFKSVLTYARPGHVYERFGPFTFELALPVQDGRMAMDVQRGWFLGALLPSWALPKSETEEFEQDGCFNFSVRLSAPLAGFIVHYRGWLKRAP